MLVYALTAALPRSDVLLPGQTEVYSSSSNVLCLAPGKRTKAEEGHCITEPAKSLTRVIMPTGFVRLVALVAKPCQADGHS